ncbi:MAG TPA: lysylphosphatidylglycerol synthase transmembrane domain-containing protein [bacterium]|nr:lysylphosphatidylglycerol synthase transmembrane domain-containing protein [bacterium]
MLKKYLPIVIGILLFAVIVRKIDLSDTLAILSHSNWWLLLAALLAFVAMTYVKGIRWSYLLKMQKESYPVWDCFLIYMGTLYLGNITPGRVGDFAKVFYLKKDLRMGLGKGLSSVLVDRVFDLYLLLILGGVGLLVNPMPVDPGAQELVLAVKIFFVALIAVSLLAFNQRIGGLLLKAAFQRLMKQEHRDKTDKLFEEFHSGMAAFYRPALLYPALLSLVSYCFFFWGCFLIAQAIQLPINLFYLSFTVSVVNIVSLMTFLGMGTRELALLLLFGLINLSNTQAMAYDVMLTLIGLILFSLLGLVCFTLKPIDLGQLRGDRAPKKRAPARKKTTKK